MTCPHVACKMITTKFFFDWSRSRDPKEAQISLYGGLGPFGSRIRAFERFEG